MLPNTDPVLLPPIPSRPINLHIIITYRQMYHALSAVLLGIHPDSPDWFPIPDASGWLGVEHRMAQDLWPVGVMPCVCVCALLVTLVHVHLAIRLLR